MKHPNYPAMTDAVMEMAEVLPFSMWELADLKYNLNLTDFGLREVADSISALASRLPSTPMEYVRLIMEIVGHYEYKSRAIERMKQCIDEAESLAMVNEQGAELIKLPRGTQVMPHAETIRMLAKESKMPRRLGRTIKKSWNF